MATVRHRVFLAFALTPLALVPLGAMAWIIALVNLNSSFSGLPAPLVLSPFVAYPIAIAIGLPLWLLIRQFRIPGLLGCVAGGILSSLLGLWILHALAIPTSVRYPDLLATWMGADLLFFGAIGIAYGVVFWAIAYARREPHTVTESAT